MDAIEFLKTEHQLIAESMGIILRSYSSHRKRLAHRLSRQVTMHDQMELRIFYAAVPSGLLSRSTRRKSKDNRHVVAKSLIILTCHPPMPSIGFHFSKAHVR
jgi:hypothetical protein